MQRERAVSVSPPAAAGIAAVALLGVAAAALLARQASAPPRRSTGAAPSLPAAARSAPSGESATARSGRRLNRAAGTLAIAVLLDSAVEHYRGSFENRAMVAPLVSSSLSLIASAHGTADRRAAPHYARDAVYALAGITGLVGTGFHFYNVGKRPGGFSWLNLFYGAPIGAPGALMLSGMLGFLAERVRDNDPGDMPSILGFPAGRAIAALTSIGMLGTVGEVGLLHFRGAYHDPFMFLPVSVPPVAALLLADRAIRGSRTPQRFARGWLRATALLGVAGVGFHTFGVARNMGGWRNWSQNVLNGPPLPAPPSFTGLALAGLAALGLMEEHPDA